MRDIVKFGIFLHLLVEVSLDESWLLFDSGNFVNLFDEFTNLSVQPSCLVEFIRHLDYLCNYDDFIIGMA